MSELITIEPASIQTQEWLARRDLLLDQASSITACGNESDCVSIAAIQGSLGKHVKVLHEDRMKLTRQIDAAKKQCIALEKDLIATLDAEKQRLQALTSAYVTEQRRREEQARKEAEERARQEAAEVAEHADERAKLAQNLFGAGFDPQLAASPPTVPTFSAPQKIAGARVVTRWFCEVVDPAKVPAALMTFNKSAAMKAIKGQAAQGQTPEIPGLRIWSENQVQSRG